jgi:hypothetical protein
MIGSATDTSPRTKFLTQCTTAWWCALIPTMQEWVARPRVFISIIDIQHTDLAPSFVSLFYTHILRAQRPNKRRARRVRRATQ